MTILRATTCKICGAPRDEACDMALCHDCSNTYARKWARAGRTYHSEKARLLETTEGKPSKLIHRGAIRNFDTIQLWFDARCYYWREVRNATSRRRADGSVLFLSKAGTELARLWIEVQESEAWEAHP